jgi:hypothetical protein
VRERVLRDRAAGLSWQAIADGLVRDRVPNPARGGVSWTVRAVRKLAARPGPEFRSTKEQALAAELRECERLRAEDRIEHERQLAEEKARRR